MIDAASCEYTAVSKLPLTATITRLLYFLFSGSRGHRIERTRCGAWAIPAMLLGLRTARTESLLRSPLRRAFVLLVGFIPPSAVLAGEWGGALGIATQSVFRGLTLSDGRPSVQGDLHYYASSGWFGGFAAQAVRFGQERDTTAELDGYLGFGAVLAPDWDLRFAATHYAYPWTKHGPRYDYDELSATLAYASQAFLTMGMTPDKSIETRRGAASGRTALFYEFTLRWPLLSGWSAGAGIGYSDLRRLADTGYAYWNAGLHYGPGSTQFDLAYVGTDATARQLFYGGVAGHRAVASVSWLF